MSLTDRFTLYFIYVCFLGMIVPYVFKLGGGNIFLNDFFAKRIMTIFSLPFFLWILGSALNRKHKIINKEVKFYGFIFGFYILYSIIIGNRFNLLITDLFIAFLPIIFYLLIFNTNFHVRTFDKHFLNFIIISAILVVTGVKLQFSYFSILAIVYTLFLAKYNFRNFLLLILIPFVSINSLIGKNALIILLFLISYFLFFDKKFITPARKFFFIIIVPLIFLMFIPSLFLEKIQATDAYAHSIYFLNNTDFSSLEFEDHSTANRLFEAERVIDEFTNSNMFLKIFGNGFGATIDLSGTVDKTIGKTNEDIKNVRNIHLGLFAVLYKYGLLGVFLYYKFIKKMFINCKVVLKDSTEIPTVLGALYLLVIMFDSLISFPHMMSNFMFWFITFIIIYKKNNISKNKNIADKELKLEIS